MKKGQKWNQLSIVFSILESPKPTKVASKMSACYCYSMLSLWASHHFSLGFLYCNIWSYGLRQYLKVLHSSILITIPTRILHRKQRDLHLKMNKVHFWRIDWFTCMSRLWLKLVDCDRVTYSDWHPIDTWQTYKVLNTQSSNWISHRSFN